MFSVYCLQQKEYFDFVSDRLCKKVVRTSEVGAKKKNNKTKTLQKLIVLISVLNCWISWLKHIRDIYGCGVSVSLTHLDDFDSCFTKKKRKNSPGFQCYFGKTWCGRFIFEWFIRYEENKEHNKLPLKVFLILPFECF